MKKLLFCFLSALNLHVYCMQIINSAEGMYDGERHKIICYVENNKDTIIELRTFQKDCFEFDTRRFQINTIKSFSLMKPVVTKKGPFLFWEYERDDIKNAAFMLLNLCSKKTSIFTCKRTDNLVGNYALSSCGNYSAVAGFKGNIIVFNLTSEKSREYKFDAYNHEMFFSEYSNPQCLFVFERNCNQGTIDKQYSVRVHRIELDDGFVDYVDFKDDVSVKDIVDIENTFNEKYPIYYYK